MHCERVRQRRNGYAVEALQRGGKYRKLDNGLEIKEVVVGG
jgi:hypothetical protein